MMSSKVPVKKEPARYGNKPFWYDPGTAQRIPKRLNSFSIYFDSELEFKTWKMLCAIVGESNVVHHYRLFLKPETAAYPCRYWEVDFRIQYGNEVKYIECKGDWIRKDSGALHNFRMQIEFLEIYNPSAWSNLIICGNANSQIDRMIPTLSVESVGQYIKQQIRGSYGLV